MSDESIYQDWGPGRGLYPDAERVCFTAHDAVPERLARALALRALGSLTTPARPPVPEDLSPDLDELCNALIAEDARQAPRIIATLQDLGVSPDRLYLDYVAGAALRLGEQWVDDTVSFVDVTIALSRLHKILRDLGPAFFSAQPAEVSGIEALFATTPGETHLLGVVMATDFFRRHGWSVDVDTTAEKATLLAAAARKRYAVIGLSASSRRMIEPLRSIIRDLRAISNSAVIVIGGHINELEPEIAKMTGADVSVVDAASAARSLEKMIARADA
jgi:methanogenic corrinoid protein MtbC1